jgi:NAD(P)H-hydrate epimerase
MSRRSCFPPAAQDRETIRAWDRRAVEEYGLPGILLMENAGAGAARLIEELIHGEPELYPPRLEVLCGSGNNGGDGFVVARHLHNHGFEVSVHLACEPARILTSPDAAVNFRVLEKMRVPIQGGRAPFPPPLLLERRAPCTLVDALLGTGLSRPLRSPYLEWVRAVNSSGLPVIALDLPSGLDADSGEVLGEAVVARWTVTFAAPKLGFTQGLGPDHTGQVHVVDIGIPREVWEGELGPTS